MSNFKSFVLAAVLTVGGVAEVQAGNIFKKIVKEIKRVPQNVPVIVHDGIKATGTAVEETARALRDALPRGGGEEDEKGSNVVPHSKGGLTFTVTKVGTELRVTFDQLTDIRQHTGSGPYADRTVTPSETVVVKRGQWLSVKRDGQWMVADGTVNR